MGSFQQPSFLREDDRSVPIGEGEGGWGGTTTSRLNHSRGGLVPVDFRVRSLGRKGHEKGWEVVKHNRRGDLGYRLERRNWVRLSKF